MDVCIREGGTGDGSAWDNALDDLPASLSRDNTYYVADGAYAGYNFDDAVDGTKVITIRKATQVDHGVEQGWLSSYGDGVASFGTLTFSTSYWTFDGAVGGGPGSWDSGHGFSIFSSTSILISLLNAISNITIAHAKMDSDRGTTFIAGIKGTVGGAKSNITVRYCAIMNVFGPPFHVGSWSNVLIEYCYVYANKNTAEFHSEGISSIGTNDDWVIRWCLWDKIEGTAVIAGVNTGQSNRWLIYGNIFSRSVTTIYYYWEPGGSNFNDMYDSKFFNNTVVGIPGVSQGTLQVQQGSGNVAYNNVWYDNDANAFFWSFSHDYTYADQNIRSEGGPFDKDAEVISGEANGWKEAGSSCFASYNDDPLLADFSPPEGFYDGNGGVDTGVSLPGNDVDMLGTVRGSGSSWARGAIEFDSGGSGVTVTPNALAAAGSLPVPVITGGVASGLSVEVRLE